MTNYKLQKLTLLFLVTCALQLSACGFSPLYGDSKAVNNASLKSNFDQIEIANIPDRSGQYLRNALLDALYRNGYPSTPHYRLEVRPIVESISDFDITIESEATRQQIRLKTEMALIDLKTGKTVLNRPLLAITSNNILESEFSTLITEQSARDAALNDLARQIERQLALFFSK